MAGRMPTFMSSFKDPNKASWACVGGPKHMFKNDPELGMPERPYELILFRPKERG